MYTFDAGLSSPVIVTAILGAASVYMAFQHSRLKIKHNEALDAKRTPLKVLAGALMGTAFMWTLSYYGFKNAAWFFLIAPILGLSVVSADLSLTAQAGRSVDDALSKLTDAINKKNP